MTELEALLAGALREALKYGMHLDDCAFMRGPVFEEDACDCDAVKMEKRCLAALAAYDEATRPAPRPECDCKQCDGIWCPCHGKHSDERSTKTPVPHAVEQAEMRNTELGNIRPAPRACSMCGGGHVPGDGCRPDALREEPSSLADAWDTVCDSLCTKRPHHVACRQLAEALAQVRSRLSEYIARSQLKELVAKWRAEVAHLDEMGQGAWSANTYANCASDLERCLGAEETNKENK